MRSLLFLLLFTASLFVGQAELDLGKLWQSDSSEYMIFFEIRVPRTILAFLVGGILALSGLIFQTIFKNPLTTPYTLGVASGATLFASLAIKLELLFLWLGISAVTLFGFIGAFFSVALLLLFSKKLKSSALLLAGIALSLFYSSLHMLVYYTSDTLQSYKIVRFMMGSLDIAGYDNLIPIALALVLLLFLTLKFSKEFGILAISDDEAMLRGVNVKYVNGVLLLIVSVAVGVCVSVTGPIGFVGLIIPHFVKKTLKKSSKYLIIPSFIYGGLFLLACDMIARVIPANSEIPIGVVTALIGAPVFVYILFKRK